jgi:hypothetical protein
MMMEYTPEEKEKALLEFMEIIKLGNELMTRQTRFDKEYQPILKTIKPDEVQILSKRFMHTDPTLALSLVSMIMNNPMFKMN